jgi:hypothetical protein
MASDTNSTRPAETLPDVQEDPNQENDSQIDTVMDDSQDHVFLTPAPKHSTRQVLRPLNETCQAGAVVVERPTQLDLVNPPDQFPSIGQYCPRCKTKIYQVQEEKTNVVDDKNKQ